MKIEVDRPIEQAPQGAKAKPWWVPSPRAWVILGLIFLFAAIVAYIFRPGPAATPQAEPDLRGTPSWAKEHYGNADSPRFRDKNIVEIDFLGEPMYVHKKVRRHFFRLAQIFQARAPEYAATIAAGSSDDWSYFNRNIRGGKSGDKSNHAFGIALDINALTNVLGTEGDMPLEVVQQWEAEGGDWGGDWSRPDPMHFETHLTPEEIKDRYQPDGTPQDWYLQELIGG